jgi:hypothetical protein
MVSRFGGGSHEKKTEKAKGRKTQEKIRLDAEILDLIRSHPKMLARSVT